MSNHTDMSFHALITQARETPTPASSHQTPNWMSYKDLTHPFKPFSTMKSSLPGDNVDKDKTLEVKSSKKTYLLHCLSWSSLSCPGKCLNHRFSRETSVISFRMCCFLWSRFSHQDWFQTPTLLSVTMKLERVVPPHRYTRYQ